LRRVSNALDYNKYKLSMPELSAPLDSHSNDTNYVGDVVTTIKPNNTIYFQARRTF